MPLVRHSFIVENAFVVSECPQLKYCILNFPSVCDLGYLSCCGDTAAIILVRGLEMGVRTVWSDERQSKHMRNPGP